MYITHYSCQIVKKFEFFRHILEKNTHISNLLKIRPIGAELFHDADGRTEGRTDGRTDITKLIVAFRNFANAPQNRL